MGQDAGQATENTSDEVFDAVEVLSRYYAEDAAAVAERRRQGQDTVEAEAALRTRWSEIEDLRAALRHADAEARGPVLVATVAGVVATPDGLADLADRATRYAEGSRAEATRRAYRSDWRHFQAWAGTHGLATLPAAPMTIGMYLAAHGETLAVATLTRRLSAISTAHRLAGHHLDTRHPAIRDVLRGVRRARGSAQRHAAALTTPMLRQVLGACGTRLIDIRDRALFLVGFSAALRESEIVALDIADITVSPEGLRVMIPRSKSDQEGEGAVLAIGRTGTATCPVAAYAAWIAAAGIAEGAVFRRIDRHSNIGARLAPEAVEDIVRARVARVGLDARAYSGHSLRAGLATSAAAAGVEERVIMRHTRHRSVATVRRYIREGTLWDRDLASEVGL